MNYDFQFINGTDMIWNDSLFVDGTHMNRDGAEALTKYWISKFEK